MAVASSALLMAAGNIHKDANKNESIEPKDVVLYGFGRIGRLVARELMTRTGKGRIRSD